MATDNPVLKYTLDPKQVIEDHILLETISDKQDKLDQFLTEHITKDGTPAWATSVPLTTAGKLIFDEFCGPGPYSNLLLLGLTEEQITEAKVAFDIEYGFRENYEDKLPDFILSGGYTVVPRSRMP